MQMKYMYHFFGIFRYAIIIYEYSQIPYITCHKDVLSYIQNYANIIQCLKDSMS